MKSIATVKLVLDSKDKSKRKLLKIRVTHDREPRIYSADTDKRLTKKEFENDKLKITKEAKEAAKKAFDIAKKIVNTLGLNFSFEKFKKEYRKQLYGSRRDKSLFAAFAEDYINGLNAASTKEGYSTAIHWVERYNPETKITSINEEFVKGLIKFMKKTRLDETEKEMSENTVRIYLRALKAIYNRALKDGVVTGNNPFSTMPLGSIERQKGALSQEEFYKLLKYRPTNDIAKMGKDFFLLSFSLSGANIGDILSLKNKNIEGGVIKFVRRKTRKSDIEIELPLTNITHTLLNEYGKINTNKPFDYILPYLQNCDSDKAIRNKIHDVVKKINNGLAKVCQDINIRPITTYSARHTYASTARDFGHLSTEQIQKFLGHASSKTTQTYLSSLSTSTIKQNKEFIESLMKTQ